MITRSYPQTCKRIVKKRARIPGSKFLLTSLIVASFCFLVVPLTATSTLSSLPEARVATAADLFGGTDAKGGAGDLLLRNDHVEAIIMDVGTTSDLPVPLTAFQAPSGGVIIDLGRRGQNNDQMNEIFQVANLDGNNAFIYVNKTISAAGSDPAWIKVSGIVLLSGFSTPSSPKLLAETTYALSSADDFITITTNVRNISPAQVPLFQISDVNLLVARNSLPFAPFPGRGFVQPPLSLLNPLPALGVFPFVGFPGALDESDGVVDPNLLASGQSGQVSPISYSLLGGSLASPLVGANHPLLSGVGSSFQPLAAGATRTFTRRLLVGTENDVNAGATRAFPLLGLPAAPLSGRVVDSGGRPVHRASVTAINVAPGALAPFVSGFVTQLDANADGVPDGLLGPFAGGEPYPINQTLTDVNGEFTIALPFFAPVNQYKLEVRAEGRNRVTTAPFATNSLPSNLTITVAEQGTVRFSVEQSNSEQHQSSSMEDDHENHRVAAKLTFIGIDGTPNPNFGATVVDRDDFPGLARSPAEVALGKTPITASTVSHLSEVFGGSPTHNVVVDQDGRGRVKVAPGRYRVYASKGIEYTMDVKTIEVHAANTTNVKLSIARAVDTKDFISADFHVHSVKSPDSSTPMEDRVVSLLAEGIEVFVPSDHDYISDFAPVIARMGLAKQLVALGGIELTGNLPVPASPLTGNINAFPQGIGHWNAFPLNARPGSRRNGAPSDEFITPAIAIDRLRALDSLPVAPDFASAAQIAFAAQDQEDMEIVQLNHPRRGVAGLTVIGLFRTLAGTGYDPTLPLTSFPNNLLLNLTSPYGTGTTPLSFDAMELLNGARPIDLRDYLAVRRDWFSLLNQGVSPTGTGVSDSHQIAIQSVGTSRSFVRMKRDSVPRFKEDKFVKSIKGMQVIGSSGPFIDFTIKGEGRAELGETTKIRKNRVTLDLEVSAAPWIPVEEIRIYANGQLVATFPVTNNPNPATGFPHGFRIKRFAEKIVVTGLTADTYFVVEAGVKIDENGNPLNPGRLTLLNIVA
ncbi:MAG TPA: CehA/McbA family metallohydrolase, partial [Pyrinomonadaceae bacterium]|nr:CehA/McbA family metallohydrolase [Pyrinomonadaceae bacterium]